MVFLVGLTDGAVPISHAIDASAEAVEEERRPSMWGDARP